MNLFLVMHEVESQHLILPQVLAELKKLGGRYRYHLVWDYEPRLKHRLWTLGMPTVTVSMRPVSTWPERRFTPSWATIWQQDPYSKSQELEMLEKAGVPVPKWTVIGKESKIDLSGFRDFVVVKPNYGALGALVKVKRRNKVRWQPLEIRWHPLKGDPGVSDELLVQEYVHTGPWPTSYRVGTVFGEPIYALRFIADRKRDPFTEEPHDASSFRGKTIVASSKGSTVDTLVPDDVIEFSKQVHDAFPTVPLLGIDIIQEYATNNLYAVEVNASGWVFHLSSVAHGQLLDRGIDLRAQFGGASAVARGIFRRLTRPIA